MRDWTLTGYTELRELGRGSFGRVALSRHDTSGTPVAIKYLYPEHLTDPAALAQFRHEAQLLAKVASAHTARLFDFVQTEQGAAIVMEAVPGVSLGSVLAADGALTPEAALAVLKGSLLGLADAHRVGVVHRDYKPDNVLVDPNGRSALVDFGIAALAGRSGNGGTPNYMAPEQWAGAAATPATDVYAATCVFFLCVTGERPYAAQPTEDLRTLHQTAPIPVQRAPEQVRGLITRGMAKDPTQRPPGAAEFVTELEAAAAASYGTDWERRGWRTLAERAGLLLALSPLALLGSTAVTGGVAGAGAAAGGVGGAAAAGAGGATVGTSAAAAGGTATAAGVAKAALATATGKVVAAVVAAAVLAAIAIAVVNAVSGKDFEVSTQTRTERIHDPDAVMTAQVVQLSGYRDPDAEKRMNTGLMAPIDRRFTAVTGAVRGASSGDGDPTRGTPQSTTTATILLQTDDLLIVRYDNDVDGTVLTHPTWLFPDAVDVDLRNGRVLGPHELLRPEVFTADGLSELVDLLYKYGGTHLCRERAEFKPLTAAAFDDARYGLGIQLALTRQGVEFLIALPNLGYETACGEADITVPYGELTDQLAPEVQALVPATPPTATPPAPSPRPSTSGDGGTGGSKALSLNGITLSVPSSWTSQANGAEQVVTEHDACGASGCPQFLVGDNTRVSAEQPAYTLGAPYSRDPRGRPCTAAGRPDLPEKPDGTLAVRQTRPVAGQIATYEEWQISCTGSAEKITQRIWYLPQRQLVIVDEYQTPGLDDILRTATLS